MATLREKLSKIAEVQYGKLKNLPPQQKEKLFRITLGIAIANLMYSLLGLYTIVSIAVTLACVYGLIKLQLEAILARGLITYLPKKTQKNLLERSLFDVLCDAWFIPRLGIIVKTILRPFFVAVNPEEAVYQLDDLPEASKKLFLQKGIVNILPENLKSILLPKVRCSVNLESKKEDSEERVSKLTKIEKRYQSNFPSDYFDPQIETQIDSCKESDITSSRERNSTISTDDEPKNRFRENMTSVKTWLNLRKPMSFGSLDPVRRLLYAKSTKPKRKSIEFKVPKKLERSYIFDPLDHGYRTEVITSSKLPFKRSQSQQDAVPKWDKLDTFLKMRVDKTRQNPRRGAAPLKGPLHTIQKVVQILQMGKQGLFARLDDKKLLRIFGLSTIVLILQFVLSKRTRCWLYNTFHILMYVTGIVLSSGSFGLYVLKLKKGSNKEIQQNSEQIQEIRQTEIRESN